jgi:hypothetical protein
VPEPDPDNDPEEEALAEGDDGLEPLEMELPEVMEAAEDANS